MSLRVTDLDAGYHKLQVLREVSIEVAPGACVAIVGPNGAGKSTLMKSIAGTLRPTGGSVELDGRDITGLRAHQLVREGIVLVPEGRHLFPDLTVRDNLVLAESVGRKLGRGNDIDHAFSMFPVLKRRERNKASQLSGGEQQMLAIARALQLGPRYILLDEPSIGLAPRIVREVMDVVGGLAGGDVGVLIVEQNAHEVMRIVDEVYVLERGRITRHGSADEILADDDLKRSYLGM